MQTRRPYTANLDFPSNWQKELLWFATDFFTVASADEQYLCLAIIKQLMTHVAGSMASPRLTSPHSPRRGGLSDLTLASLKSVVLPPFIPAVNETGSGNE